MINKLHEHSIDDLFRVKLNEGEQHIDFREADWDAMEKRLNRPGNNTNRFRFYAAAAVLLLAMGGAWLFLNPSTKTHQKDISMVVPDRISPVLPDVPGSNHNGFDLPDLTSNGKSEAQTTVNTTPNNSPMPVEEDNTVPNNGNASLHAIPAMQSEYMPAPSNTPITLAALTVNAKPVRQALFYHNPTVSRTFMKKGIRDNWSDFTVGVRASTDLNGAGNFQRAALGNNIGLMLTMHLIGNWNITTGAMYARKPYNIAYSQYHAAGTYPFSGQPNQVHADYRMLDMPVNINYTLSSDRDSRVLVDAGISSYIMLAEKYYYEYGSYDNETKELSVNDHDNQWLSVINLGISYEKKIANNISIDFQPYIKLPLNKFGYGRVRLQSLGLALKLNWGIPEI